MSIENAEKAYHKRKFEAEELVRKIGEKLEADRFIPAQAWACVGTMGHIRSQLQDISDMLCGEGEYADDD